MDVNFLSYPPDDPQLVDRIVNEFLSQGKFDKLRKQCMADVDTKPAYQNLQQRVENTVTMFLKKQQWKPDLNKNQLRDALRKHILESGFLDTGINRIVDQVVNPNVLATVFLPQVEEVVYNFLGIKKPTLNNVIKPDHGEEMKDEPAFDNLDNVSPDSTGEKSKKFVFPNEEESIQEEEGEDRIASRVSNDSHLSGMSELTSHGSNPDTTVEEPLKELETTMEEDGARTPDYVKPTMTEPQTKMEVDAEESRDSVSGMGVELLKLDGRSPDLPDSDSSIPLEINEHSPNESDATADDDEDVDDDYDDDDSILNKMSPISPGKATPDLPEVPKPQTVAATGGIPTEKPDISFLGRIPKIKRNPDDKDDGKIDRVDVMKNIYSSEDSDSHKDNEERTEPKRESGDKRKREERGMSEEKRRDRSKSRDKREKSDSKSRRDEKDRSSSKSKDNRRERSRERHSASSAEKKSSSSRSEDTSSNIKRRDANKDKDKRDISKRAERSDSERRDDRKGSRERHYKNSRHGDSKEQDNRDNARRQESSRDRDRGDKRDRKSRDKTDMGSRDREPRSKNDRRESDKDRRDKDRRREQGKDSNGSERRGRQEKDNDSNGSERRGRQEKDNDSKRHDKGDSERRYKDGRRDNERKKDGGRNSDEREDNTKGDKSDKRDKKGNTSKDDKDRHERKKKSKIADDHGKEHRQRGDRRSSDRDSNERERDKSAGLLEKGSSRKVNKGDSEQDRVNRDEKKGKGESESKENKQQKRKTDNDGNRAKCAKLPGVVTDRERIITKTSDDMEKPRKVVNIVKGIEESGPSNEKSCPVVLCKEEVPDSVLEARLPDDCNVETSIPKLENVQVSLVKKHFPTVANTFYHKFGSEGFRYFEKSESLMLDCEEEFVRYISNLDPLSLSDVDSDSETMLSTGYHAKEFNRRTIKSLNSGLGNLECGLVLDVASGEFFQKQLIRPATIAETKQEDSVCQPSDRILKSILMAGRHDENETIPKVKISEKEAAEGRRRSDSGFSEEKEMNAGSMDEGGSNTDVIEDHQKNICVEQDDGTYAPVIKTKLKTIDEELKPADEESCVSDRGEVLNVLNENQNTSLNAVPEEIKTTDLEAFQEVSLNAVPEEIQKTDLEATQEVSTPKSEADDPAEIEDLKETSSNRTTFSEVEMKEPDTEEIVLENGFVAVDENTFSVSEDSNCEVYVAGDSLKTHVVSTDMEDNDEDILVIDDSRDLSSSPQLSVKELEMTKIIERKDNSNEILEIDCTYSTSEDNIDSLSVETADSTIGESVIENEIEVVDSCGESNPVKVELDLSNGNSDEIKIITYCDRLDGECSDEVVGTNKKTGGNVQVKADVKVAEVPEDPDVTEVLIDSDGIISIDSEEFSDSSRKEDSVVISQQKTMEIIEVKADTSSDASESDGSCSEIGDTISNKFEEVEQENSFHVLDSREVENVETKVTDTTQVENRIVDNNDDPENILNRSSGNQCWREVSDEQSDVIIDAQGSDSDETEGEKLVTEMENKQTDEEAVDKVVGDEQSVHVEGEVDESDNCKELQLEENKKWERTDKSQETECEIKIVAEKSMPEKELYVSPALVIKNEICDDENIIDITSSPRSSISVKSSFTDSRTNGSTSVVNGSPERDRQSVQFSSTRLRILQMKAINRTTPRPYEQKRCSQPSSKSCILTRVTYDKRRESGESSETSGRMSPESIASSKTEDNNDSNTEGTEVIGQGARVTRKRKMPEETTSIQKKSRIESANIPNGQKESQIQKTYTEETANEVSRRKTGKRQCKDNRQEQNQPLTKKTAMEIPKRKIGTRELKGESQASRQQQLPKGNPSINTTLTKKRTSVIDIKVVQPEDMRRSRRQTLPRCKNPFSSTLRTTGTKPHKPEDVLLPSPPEQAVKPKPGSKRPVVTSPPKDASSPVKSKQYATDDLYKPRPVFSAGPRLRGRRVFGPESSI